MCADSNSSLNHLILQIWLHRISNSLDIYRSFHGRAVEDSEAVIMVINVRIEEQYHNFFCEGVKALQQR